jgi:hypothetical protein
VVSFLPLLWNGFEEDSLLLLFFFLHDGPFHHV